MAAASLRVRQHGLGMVGYVLSHAGAEWLLKAALPLEDKAIDQVRRFGLRLRHNTECSSCYRKCTLLGIMADF